MRPEGRLFSQLMEQVRFEINNQTGEPLSDKDMVSVHYARISKLQRDVFVKYPDLPSLALATIASIEDRDPLVKHCLLVNRDTLDDICEYLHLVPVTKEEDRKKYT